MASRRATETSRDGSAVAPVMPPQPHQLTTAQAERRERIVSTALEFMRHHEYDDIQMRDVAEAADVALGTLYRYFPSKEQLFAAVLVRWGASLHERVEKAPAPSGAPADAVAEIYRRAIDGFERYPQFFRLVHVVEQSADPLVRVAYDEFRALTDRTFRASAGDDEVGRIESLVLRATLDILLRRWTTGECSIQAARADMDAAVRLVHRGR